jgi:hypothetical protein
MDWELGGDQNFENVLTELLPEQSESARKRRGPISLSSQERLGIGEHWSCLLFRCAVASGASTCEPHRR